MDLGTGHIHLLDTESFSDYSPPIELSDFGRAEAATELFERPTRNDGDFPTR
jgi:hypothetical protein